MKEGERKKEVYKNKVKESQGETRRYFSKNGAYARLESFSSLRLFSTPLPPCGTLALLRSRLGSTPSLA